MEGNRENPNSQMLVLPVNLRLIYKESDLKGAAYFHIETHAETVHSVPPGLGVSSARLRPKFGTTEDICAPGDPGLI